MDSRLRRPLRAFRIADSRHRLLDGEGAFRLGGRWTSVGKKAIYAAESFAGALLEVLVHADIGRLPRNDSWIEVIIPPEITIEEVDGARMPGWDARTYETAQAYGDRWFQERRTAVLLVPAIVTGGVERNVILNQEHPHFPLLQASQPKPVAWDSRLFGR